MAKDKLIPCLIHIPCSLPDGTALSAEKLNEILSVLDRQFGGSTVLGTVSGRWVAPDGATVAEQMLRVEVSVREGEIERFEQVAIAIGRETGQTAVYVVINVQAETRILSTNAASDEQQASGAG